MRKPFGIAQVMTLVQKLLTKSDAINDWNYPLGLGRYAVLLRMRMRGERLLSG